MLSCVVFGFVKLCCYDASKAAYAKERGGLATRISKGGYSTHLCIHVFAIHIYILFLILIPSNLILFLVVLILSFVFILILVLTLILQTGRRGTTPSWHCPGQERSAWTLNDNGHSLSSDCYHCIIAIVILNFIVIVIAIMIVIDICHCYFNRH